MLSYTDASWVTVSSYTVKVRRRNSKKKERKLHSATSEKVKMLIY